MSKSGKTLVRYNVANGKYAMKSSSGYESPADLTWLTAFSKEKNLSTKTIYGDGELQITLVNDKGFTGTIGMTAQDDEYNKALGFLMNVDGGIAEVKQTEIKEHAIYFETDYIVDGVEKRKKTWVFGVETQAPSESFEQNTDDINETNAEYTITIKGVNLKDSEGTADYVDETSGKTVKCFTYSKTPTDTGYATFGDSVPTPKMTS